MRRSRCSDEELYYVSLPRGECPRRVWELEVKLRKQRISFPPSQAQLVNYNMNSFLAAELRRVLRLAPLLPVLLPLQGGVAEVEQSQVAPQGF